MTARTRDGHVDQATSNPRRGIRGAGLVTSGPTAMASPEVAVQAVIARARSGGGKTATQQGEGGWDSPRGRVGRP